MNLLDRIGGWGDNHHPRWLDIIRFALGIFLFWKGVMFIQNRDDLITLINTHRDWAALSVGMAHFIIFAHLLGGLFIALGLLTRLAIIVNLPILVGALFFANSPTGLFSAHTVLWQTVLCLCMMIFFLVEGSGPWSIDGHWRRHPEEVA
ncbi:DoxX family protein [Chitinophaga parva]|uniref:DoxX family protein n=1 Tax=Chitinophaga parva TaxID=2169414 RepID=A0A2T7BDY9_9BACT|nr:DoxX family protein [Chitinophaga parva]PUZ23301.1 DoxX family protein [Chitinophaga parva]